MNDIDWNEELVISTAISNIIDLKRKYFNLQQENHQLKADYGTKVQVERDLLKEQNQKQKEVIDKAINKLYECGEALYPEFQRIILDILKEVE